VKAAQKRTSPAGPCRCRWTARRGWKDVNGNSILKCQNISSTCTTNGRYVAWQAAITTVHETLSDGELTLGREWRLEVTKNVLYVIRVNAERFG